MSKPPHPQPSCGLNLSVPGAKLIYCPECDNRNLYCLHADKFTRRQRCWSCNSFTFGGKKCHHCGYPMDTSCLVVWTECWRCAEVDLDDEIAKWKRWREGVGYGTVGVRESLHV